MNKSNKTRKLPHPSELSAKARRARLWQVSFFGILGSVFIFLGIFGPLSEIFPNTSNGNMLAGIIAIIATPIIAYFAAKWLYYADIKLNANHKDGYYWGRQRPEYIDDLDPSNGGGLNNAISLRSNLNINNPNNPLSQNYPGNH